MCLNSQPEQSTECLPAVGLQNIKRGRYGVVSLDIESQRSISHPIINEVVELSMSNQYLNLLISQSPTDDTIVDNKIVASCIDLQSNLSVAPEVVCLNTYLYVLSLVIFVFKFMFFNL